MHSSRSSRLGVHGAAHNSMAVLLIGAQREDSTPADAVGSNTRVRWLVMAKNQGQHSLCMRPVVRISQQVLTAVLSYKGLFRAEKARPRTTKPSL